jgi:hypothetical protein
LIQQLADFIRLHWVKCLALLLVHLFLLVTIGLQNVPYIDDTGRRLWGEGLTNWGPDDGRWGSHYLNVVLTGSRWRLVDLGLTTFVISAVILTAAALIVIYLLVGQQANWLTFAVSIGFTLNPWALGILAFRFDGPFGAVSILLAVLPLLWFGSSALIAIVISALSIFLMANFYQHSFGIAICLLLLVALVRYLAGQMALREVLRAIAVTVSGFVLGIVLYLLQLAMIPATNEDYFAEFSAIC